MYKEGRSTINCDWCGKETHFYGPAGPQRTRLHGIGWTTMTRYEMPALDACPACNGKAEEANLAELNEEIRQLAGGLPTYEKAGTQKKRTPYRSPAQRAASEAPRVANTARNSSTKPRR